MFLLSSSMDTKFSSSGKVASQLRQTTPNRLQRAAKLVMPAAPAERPGFGGNIIASEKPTLTRNGNPSPQFDAAQQFQTKIFAQPLTTTKN